MEEHQKNIRFPAGVYGIARKVAKVVNYTHEINNTASAHRCTPCMTELPTATMVVLPSTGALAIVTEVRPCTCGMALMWLLPFDMHGCCRHSRHPRATSPMYRFWRSAASAYL